MTELPKISKKSVRRSPGRPRAEVVDRAKIGRAVLDLLRLHGPDSLRMSRVAEQLGVRSQSLYHHVSGPNDLVESARVAILSEMGHEIFNAESWLETALKFAESYHSGIKHYPHALGLLYFAPVSDSSTFLLYESFISRLEQDGIDGRSALKILLEIEQTVFARVYEGIAVRELLNSQSAREAGADLLAQAIDGLQDRSRTDEQVTIRQILEPRLRAIVADRAAEL